MSQSIEIRGLNELLARMSAYPQELIKTVAVGMSASLNILWENVPPYPSPPQDSRYRRTGTLGRSLGSDQSGGAAGSPSVYSIRQLGQGNFEGTFGTNLEYAPYVIGDTMQAAQNSHWWRMRNIAEKAAGKINALWDSVAEKLAAFLEGKGG